MIKLLYTINLVDQNYIFQRIEYILLSRSYSMLTQQNYSID